MSLPKKIFHEIDSNQIKNLIAYLPFIVIFVPALGLVNLIAYYKTFGITITVYLSLSEVFLLQTFSILNTILFLLTWVVFLFLVSFDLKANLTLLTIILVVFIVVHIILPHLGKFQLPFNKLDEKGVQKIFIFFYFTYGLVLLLRLKIWYPIFTNKIMTIYLIITFLTIAYQNGVDGAGYRLSKSKKHLYKTTFFFSDGTVINTSPDTILLGQSNSYIFLHLVKDSTNLIYSKSNLILIKY